MLFTKRFLAIAMAIFVFTTIAQTQEYDVFKGVQEHSIKKSFKDMEEQDKLYPEMKTSGRRIKNDFEKYPDLPFDESEIKYQTSEIAYKVNSGEKETSPPPDKDFLGLDDSGNSIPPDVNGCPGPDHLMVTLNTDTRIMEKDGTPISTITTGIFWHPLPGSGDTFDPKISYDPYENRWIYVIPSSSSPASSKLFVGVSETSDPTGNWFTYSFDTDPNDNHWFDYPNYGFNKDWIVVTGNMFGSGQNYVAVFVFNKHELYNNAVAVNYTRFATTDGFTIVPAKTYDEYEEDIYMVNNAGGDNGGYGYLRLWKITGETNDPQLVNLGTVGIQAPWNNGSYSNGGNFAPQLGTDLKINTVDARMENTIFRNGKLWTTHHVYLPAGENPNRSSVQWWELDPYEVSINQWGRVDDTTGVMYSAFATIAVNAKEDVMIGYCSFSENQYASSSYVMRYADDPPNTMRDPYQYKDGLAPYWKTFGGDRNRWGDYTATYVDPVDDLDFWTLQEFADLPSGDDHWSTWWAYVDLHATPEANFTSTYQEIPVQSSNNFTDLSKFNPETWEWHFEGGEPATSSDQNPQNIYYEAAGTYDVTLISGNATGKDTITMENYIDVNTTILPEAQFSVNDTIPSTTDLVYFEDKSLYNPISWTWEFSSSSLVTFMDGTDKHSQNPVVSFENPYSYTVTLITENNNGSASITKESLIHVGGVQLPFTEDFESASFDSKSWTIENPDEEKTWELTPLNVNGSEYSSFVNIKNYNGFEERDRLISPLINFYYHKDITLSFKYAYAQRIESLTDSLIVYLSENGGETWSRLVSLGEDTATIRKFATHEPTFTSFLPEDTAHWCGALNNPQCISIDLSEYYGKPNMRIMFESFNSFGNNLFLDDIVIEGAISSTPEITSARNDLNIFPNPSNGLVSISLKELKGEKSIIVMDLMGKVVFEKIAESNLEVASINLEHLLKGIYIIEVRNMNSSYTQKLILR